MTVVGWRASFYITSLAALVVAMIWYFSVTDYPDENPSLEAWQRESHDRQRAQPKSGIRSLPLSDLLKNRNVLLLSLSYICEGYVLFIFVFWLYLYLVQVRGFTILSGGFAASLPWLTAFACTPVGGWICDRLAEKNGRIVAARIVIMIGYGVSGVLLFTAALAAGRNASVAALCLSIGGLYFAEPAFWATAVHISGENVGASSGLMNTAGILGGIVSTSLVPVLVQHFGWITAFGSGAMVALACTGAWVIMGRMGFGNSIPQYAASSTKPETEPRA
jgi:ACS family glucarate transporter-like MFS transporter